MPITIVCVGKMRDSYFKDAANEYQKRLSRLMPIRIVELPDEPEPAKPSAKLDMLVKAKEGERILTQIDKQDYVIAMTIDGKMRASEKFASHISDLFTQGKSQITFVIGGSLGLSDSVVSRANECMSLSSMTFPHQFARVMLLEQLFRVGKINAGERYHK